jgi:hypothetical protein
MQFSVSVTRTCHYDHVLEVEADNVAEAEEKALAEARNKDAHGWAATWDDPEIDGVSLTGFDKFVGNVFNDGGLPVARAAQPVYGHADGRVVVNQDDVYACLDDLKASLATGFRFVPFGGTK